MSSIRLTENQATILKVAVTEIGGRYPTHTEIGQILGKPTSNIGHALESICNKFAVATPIEAYRKAVQLDLIEP